MHPTINFISASCRDAHPKINVDQLVISKQILTMTMALYELA
jgi:hypothetical protein